MRALLLLAALLVLPAASARAPGEDYRDQVLDVLAWMDDAIVEARIATVEHYFGDRTERETAHAMRQAHAAMLSFRAQLAGLVPPARYVDEHAVLEGAAGLYAEGLGDMETCYRRSAAEVACGAAHDLLEDGARQRDLAASGLGARGRTFS